MRYLLLFKQDTSEYFIYIICFFLNNLFKRNAIYKLYDHNSGNYREQHFKSYIISISWIY